MTDALTDRVDPAATTPPAVRIDAAVVAFGGVRAVDGVTLDIAPGTLHGIIGPNGSGKTTLLNAVSGVQRLTAGRIAVHGRATTHLSAHEVSRSGVARTFQTIKLLPDATVWDNVALGADHRFPGRGKARAKAVAEATDRALERLAITSLARRSPEELSYGTRRRIEIARAIVADPNLLLLDEPLAGMNRSERAEIAELVVGLRDDGLTQIVIEHDLRTMLGICDRLAVLHHGKLIADGPPQDTAALPEVREIYLGRRHDDTP
jgi:ABC-type branched-subunit amino acid transport system ATPase component